MASPSSRSSTSRALTSSTSSSTVEATTRSSSSVVVPSSSAQISFSSSSTPTSSSIPPLSTSDRSTSSTPRSSSTPVSSTIPSSSTTSSSIVQGTTIAQTVTRIVTARPASTESSTASSSSQSFFSNTGAVAGTFSVVGLIALAALVFIFTTILRKRKRKAFERDADAAAAEVVATSHRGEEFYDDNGYTGAGAASKYYTPSTMTGAFSDGAHGGAHYAAPMSAESYPMSDMALYPDYPSASGGGALALGSGAAGIGALGRQNSLRAPQEDPYAAYANVTPGTHASAHLAAYPYTQPGGGYAYPAQPRQVPPNQNLRYRTAGSNQGHGFVDAENMVGAEAARNISPTPTNATHQRVPSESYASHYAPTVPAPPSPEAQSDPFRRATMIQPSPNPYAGEEYPNPEQDFGESDAEDGQRGKILKVANQ